MNLHSHMNGHCDDCPIASLVLCHPGEGAELRSKALREAYRRVHEGFVIYRQGDPCEHFFTLFDGWAIRYKNMSYGHRQILSVLLPGDPISLPLLRSNKLDFSVMALTPGALCVFSRAAMAARLRTDPSFAGKLEAFCAREGRVADERIADLARSASERIARFILDLFVRLRMRGMVADGAFVFPLRQHHIGDALGLTPIHVGRVLRQLRDDGLIEFGRNRLVVRDYQGLLKIAGATEEALASLLDL